MSPLTAAPHSSARTTGRQVISPAQNDYLRRQARNILISGGSEADVLRFLNNEGFRTPPVIEPPEGAPRLPGIVQGLSMNALQGVMFGFGDEAIGGLVGLLTGEGAHGGVERFREELKAFNEANPKKAFGAEIAGALLTGVGAAAGVSRVGARLGIKALAAEAPSIAQRVGAAALQGGAAGAVSGAGHSEGPVTQRAIGALIGGTGGAVLGGGLVGGARVAGAVTRPVARAATKGLTRLQRALGLGSSKDHALELLARAVASDGLDANDLRRAYAALRSAGINPTVADLAGDATLKLAAESAALRTPEKQRLIEMLLTRQGEQDQRLMGGLLARVFKDTRIGLRNAYDAEDALIKVRETAARPLYEAAFKEQVSVTPRIKELLERDIFRQAWDAGRRIAEVEELAGIGHGLKIPPLPKAGGGVAAKLAEMGVPPEKIAQLAGEAFPEALPVRGLDYMKRGLDEIIKKSIQAEKPSLDRRGVIALRSLVNEILDEADSQVKPYESARAVYKGFSEMKDAVILGRDFLKKAPEIVKRELRGLHPSARDFYRLGAAQSLYEQVSRAASEKTDVARRFFGGRLFSKESLDGVRIRALFPSKDAADEFMRQVAGEARVSYTTARAAGAAKGGALQSFEETVEGAVPTVRATPGVMLANIVRSGIVRARTGFTNEVSDDVSSLFAQGMLDPLDTKILIDAIEDTQLRLALQNKLGSTAALTLGYLTGKVN